MTNQEAISVLESINAKTDYFLINDDARAEAIDIAISALQAQDLQSTCNNLATDTISRQAAIDALCRRCDLAAEDDEPCTEKCNDIKILEKLPSAQSEPCEDAVSRREVIDAIGEVHPLDYNAQAIKSKIEKLPSVTPKRKTGKWILLEECANAGYYCSECRKRVVKEGWSGTVKKIKFCPNCGADMRQREENK